MIGWGWTQWGEWVDDSCPEACGRRCRVRRRNCAGQFHLACLDRGVAYQFENCDALPSGGDFVNTKRKPAVSEDYAYEDQEEEEEYPDRAERQFSRRADRTSATRAPPAPANAPPPAGTRRRLRT